MPSGGMSQEAVHCENFSDIGSRQNVKVSTEQYLNVIVDKESVVTFRVPSGISGLLVYLGSSNASVSVEKETSAKLDANGVYWYK